jgi:lysophospholipase L1-like esterase
MRSRTSLFPLLPALAVVLVALAPARAEDAPRFPLKDGDTWVMAGDSITAQHLHSNYFEAFCYARYPKMTFRFRNSGVGGDTIPKVLARYDWDVAPWHPTVVSVELGMNDQGQFSVEQYIANMGKLNDRIIADKARPVYFTASPVNDGATTAKLEGRDAKLDQYAKALERFAEEKKAPFADQFHALLDPWGKNKPNEAKADAIEAVRKAAKVEGLAGAEHLKAFLDEQAKQKTQLVSMQGDAVHPGPNGQLMMAAALLKGLGASAFVSNVILDGTTGKVISAKGCAVEELPVKETGVIAFERLDEALPFPIPDEARQVMAFDPTILELSQYLLTAKGLKGDYKIQVNGTELGTVSAKDLENGVNLTKFAKGPIAEQAKQILTAVAAKEGVVGQWRSKAKAATAADASADAKREFAELTKKVEDADAKIREAAKPQKLKFELIPAKG